MTHDEALKQIAARLGPGGLSTAPEELRHYGQDWSGALEPRPSAVAFPRSTAEISDILRLCSKAALAVVPSGGRTGLSGGATATKGELVLSLSKMTRMGAVDAASRTVRVQAGAVTEAVHAHCLRSGLTWPVDFASKGSSQVGGNLATNAGGVRVIHYGMTRSWVQSIELVLASGEVLELNGELEKNNSGYDLRNLVIGSEGTLGVITEATLRLTPPPRHADVLFFGLADMRAVIRLFEDARKAALPILAFEFLDRACYAASLRASRAAPPVPEADAHVLLELEASEAREAWLASVFERGLVVSGTQAQSSKESQSLWNIREGVAESILNGHLVHQHDVSVPISRLAEFTAAVAAKYAELAPDLGRFIFGHIGDGNLHVFLQKPPEMPVDAFRERCAAGDLALFAFIRDFRGSVSAEHGIGLLKKPGLPYTRSAREIELLRGIKRAFDPAGILNPGKIVD